VAEKIARFLRGRAVDPVVRHRDLEPASGDATA
jgi:hypothetical protein